MDADGAACPFTTGLFCIPNFRPLKRPAEASVQHCADGWVMKTWVSCRDMVANRWAHCFCWQTRCLVGAWVGKSVSPPPLSSTIVICSTLSDSHTADHMRWVGIMRGLQLNWPWMAKNVRNAADTRGVVSVRGEAEGKVAFYWLHHYLSIAKKKVHQLTLQTLTSLPVSVPSSWLISQHSRQAGN